MMNFDFFHSFKNNFRMISLLWHPHIGAYLICSFISTIFSWATKTYLLFVAWSQLEKIWFVGVLGFLDMIPALFLGTMASLYIDRMSARKILTLSLSLSLFVSVLTFTYSFIVGSLNFELLIMIFLGSGIASACSQPARQAILREIAPEGQIDNIVSLNSFLFYVSGGIAAVIIGYTTAYELMNVLLFFNSLSYLLLIVSLLRFNPTIYNRAYSTVSGGIWSNFSEGVAYANREGHLRTLLISSVAFTLFIRPMFEYLPAIAFGSGNLRLDIAGSILFVSGLGMTLGALTSAKPSTYSPVVQLVMIVVIGGAIAVLSLGPSIYIMYISIFIAAILSSNVVIRHIVLIQKTCHEEMIGRIVGQEAVVRRSLLAVGTLCFGFLGDLIGIYYSIYVTIFMACLVQVLIIVTA